MSKSVNDDNSVMKLYMCIDLGIILKSLRYKRKANP